MISIEHVSKVFGQTTAVNDLSLEIKSGELCVLIGPSGSGKTTLLRMINRLVEPTRGRILIDGRDTRSISPEKLRLSIGYAIQSVGLFPHMTVAENIGVVPSLLRWGKSRIAGRTRELIELVGLPQAYAAKFPAELSGGEAQRVGVARALAADPPLLLMDEPFGAVDPLTRQKLQAEFARIQQKLHKTVVLVTHDLDEAIRLADRVAIIRQGQLVQYDTPDNILSTPANKFVHDFVGSDRALKRLSRLGLKNLIKPAVTISINASSRDALNIIDDKPSLWVIGENGLFAGWVSQDSLKLSATVAEAMALPDTNEAVLSRDATLRDALSLMLGQGVRTLPVVDGENKIIGELNLDDIQVAIAAGKEMLDAP